MKYVIVGAGPTGLSLACALAESGHRVTVLEKEAKAGGGWTRDIDETGRAVENSPRVLVGTHRGFFADLGAELENVYGNAFATNLKLASYLARRMTCRDMLVLAFRRPPPDISLQRWMEVIGMSDQGAVALRKLCILVNDVPEKTNAREFYNTVTSFETTGLRKFKDADEWVRKALIRIRSFPDCFVFVNTPATSLVSSSCADRVHAVVAGNREFTADRVVLCTQSTGLIPVLRDTPFARNWETLTQQWVQRTTYHAFGFQIHFGGPVRTPPDWCWSCSGAWTVIALPVEQRTLSCCVVDLDAPSDKTGLSANSTTDRNDVEKECLRQMYGSNVPTDIQSITFSEGLRHEGQWVSRHTGFTSGTNGRLPLKGKASNLFAAGCFTEASRPKTAQAGTAIDAAVLFLNLYEPGSTGFHTRYPDWYSIVYAAIALAAAVLFTRYLTKNGAVCK